MIRNKNNFGYRLSVLRLNIVASHYVHRSDHVLSFEQKVLSRLQMPDVMLMKGLRRNEDAIKNYSRYHKN